MSTERAAGSFGGPPSAALNGLERHLSAVIVIVCRCDEVIITHLAVYANHKVHPVYAAAMGETLALHTAIRSAGASSTCRPRLPALTITVGKCSTLLSITVGKALR